MEALQSCLPHQLDLRTEQLWADGQSTLQLHQQWQAARASAHLTSSLVLPPDSEIVAPVLIRSPSGIQLGRCSLIEPQIALTERYGVLVGRTLVDASEWLPVYQFQVMPVCISVYQFQVMPFGLCNAPVTFERLMDRVFCGMRWSRCLVYLDDVISFGTTAPEALQRLEEVLEQVWIASYS